MARRRRRTSDADGAGAAAQGGDHSGPDASEAAQAAATGERLAGVAPSMLLAQVTNTAAWALGSDDDDDDGDSDGGRARDAGLASRGARDHRWILRAAPELERDGYWASPAGRLDYLALLLAAHFTTVATFVPTDVDTRIRHHAWQELETPEALAQSVALLDALLDGWRARAVSARVVATRAGDVSGHDGEWLAVRAGALGRALALRDAPLASALAERIARELAREADGYAEHERAADAPGAGDDAVLDALRCATVLAHNVGDLSRVVEAWPGRAGASPQGRELRAAFARLGHERPERHGGAFHRAGHVNKLVMAVENHRFLALRPARALRRERAYLLPIGPFFDAWGARIGRHGGLDATERAEVLGALLEGHERDPGQQGYLRAIAGLHATHAGGIDALAPDVPARLRRVAAAGAVRDALRLEPARFHARVVNRYRAARAAYSPLA